MERAQPVNVVKTNIIDLGFYLVCDSKIENNNQYFHDIKFSMLKTKHFFLLKETVYKNKCIHVKFHELR